MWQGWPPESHPGAATGDAFTAENGPPDCFSGLAHAQGNLSQDEIWGLGFDDGGEFGEGGLAEFNGTESFGPGIGFTRGEDYFLGEESATVLRG